MLSERLNDTRTYLSGYESDSESPMTSNHRVKNLEETNQFLLNYKYRYDDVKKE